MRALFLTSTLAALALAGCASTPGADTPNAALFNTATVAGVVNLPEGAPGGGDPCTGLVVVATSNQTTVGKAVVRTSRARCSYEISQLPDGAEINLEVKPPASWQCADGAAPGFTPQAQLLKLRPHETQTRDFRALCTRKAG